MKASAGSAPAEKSARRAKWELWEDHELRFRLEIRPVSRKDLERIAKDLGRTFRATEQRAYDLDLLPLLRETTCLTVQGLTEKTGYNRKRIQRVLKELRIVPHRWGRYRVVPNVQLPRIYAALTATHDRVHYLGPPRGLWGVVARDGRKRAEACLSCNRNTLRHKGRGLCVSCWDREWQRKKRA